MYKRTWFRSILTFLLLFLVVLQPLSQVVAQEEGVQIRITQVDNSHFPQVTVYVSTTDANGEPVSVDPNTIQIHENGELMVLDQVSGSGEVGSLETELATMLVIDVSGSMDKSKKLESAKSAAKAYVDEMRSGDQTGLMTFNTEVMMNQALTSDQGALMAEIDALQAFDDTAMYDALLAAVQSLESVSSRKAIIVLTDGLDNRSKANEDAVIQAIGPSGLSISTIGLGDPKEGATIYGLDVVGLQSLASRTGGGYGYAATSEVLSALYQQQSRVLQSEYIITYTSPSNLRDGLNRSLSISLKSGNLPVETQYNPGGVLPEVSGGSWTLFVSILAGLVALLVVPFLVNRTAEAFSSSKPTSRGRKAKGRIKFDKPPEATNSQPRIKLK